ncbi:zinc finger protein VAR3, chloroplastic [Cocos nucifera]|uniref:Zinc finger protein VAR3, chloroplastic n=1 Tax=Cocos nucifera TaxID=13894 RepID=A0A8K0MYV6_COCNU|nr:zinc finger protein VAR3, chloroplastic [Cocos nucifera]
MAASRLLQLSSPFFLRASKTHPLSLRPSLLPLSNLRPFAVIRPPRLQSFTTDAAASVDEPPATAEEVAAASYPWPEWDRFVEKLKSKGYFERSASAGAAEDDEGDGGSATAADAKMELNLLKNGCLKFARERFDILSSLPKEDIRSIVECGCPNLFRKSVNSAKRLRAFLQLDEGDVSLSTYLQDLHFFESVLVFGKEDEYATVLNRSRLNNELFRRKEQKGCSIMESACNLRGSCDKAYIIQHEEGGARTVDVVRILLSYAVNPVNLSGGENPSVKENVQESARKLLSQLIELSDTTIDPSLPKPAVSTPAQKEPSQKLGSRNKHPPNVDMKRGDWLCPKCDFINFRRNRVCLKCNCNRPEHESSRFEDRLWRRPKDSSKNTSINAGDDEDDDILPLHEGEKFVVSKRATPSGRRLTSARRSNPA